MNNSYKDITNNRNVYMFDLFLNIAVYLDPMKYAAIIPARFDSKRLPGKVLELIGDYSILQHAVANVQATKLFDSVTVATDDERVITHCDKHKIAAVMTKSTHISGTDRVAEAAQVMDADVIVNVQADEPFVTTKMLASLCQLFTNESVEIGTLCHLIEEAGDVHDFNKVKVVKDIHGQALYFSRQAIPAMKMLPYRAWFLHQQYYKHIGIYGFRRDKLQQIVQLKPSSLELAESLEQLRWLQNGYHIHVATVKGQSMGIDTAEDLAAARKWYKKHHR